MLLDGGQKNLLRLTRKGMEENDGWAVVSKAVWPMIVMMPTDLIERHLLQDGTGIARLTDRGEAVLDYSFSFQGGP